VGLRADLDTFYTLSLDTASMKIAALLLPVQHRSFYHFTFTDQKAPDNTEVRISLQNCGSSWSFMSLVWLQVFGSSSHIFGKFVDSCCYLILTHTCSYSRIKTVTLRLCQVINT